jgi:hypothetical protein
LRGIHDAADIRCRRRCGGQRVAADPGEMFVPYDGYTMAQPDVTMNDLAHPGQLGSDLAWPERGWRANSIPSFASCPAR